MNHIAPVEAGLDPSRMAVAERAAAAMAAAFERLVTGARARGWTWEEWPEDAVFLVIRIEVPADLRDDTRRLIDTHYHVQESLRAAGVPYSPYVVPDFSRFVGD